MKLGDIVWGKVHRDDVYLVQHAVNGNVFTCTQGWFSAHKDELTILAKRPKPPLTKEQIEAVREFVEWLDGQTGCGIDSVDYWLAQRGGKHE